MFERIFPDKFRQWLGPLLAAGLGVAVLAIIVLVSGVVDTSATIPHPQGWAEFLHAEFRRSTSVHSRDLAIPVDLAAPERLRLGAAVFARECSHCHGAPGVGQNPVAMSMTPRPQYLITQAPTFDERSLFWIVKHGVKYSGMPAWPSQVRDDEVWSIVAFLRAMPKLSHAAYTRLAYGDAQGEVPDIVRDPAFAMGRRPAYKLGGSEVPPLDQFSYTRPVNGFDDFSAAGNPLQSCVGCHGVDGRGGGAIPDLTLQDPTYLATALRAYAAGKRESGIMQPVAVQLSVPQMDALATYFARRRSGAGSATPTPAVVRGAKIAEEGVASRRVGGCENCHGQPGAAKAIPRLSGQHFWYLRNQMNRFASGRRGNTGGLNPMPAEAHKMTAAEIDAVSRYYAGRQPDAGHSRPPR